MPILDPQKRRAYHREWVRRRRAEWFRTAGPCVKCGSTENLELDHIDPATKVHHAIWSWSEARRLAEIAKCQVLCRECHIEKSAREKRTPVVHGTDAGYRKGCKCRPCLDARNERKRKWRATVRTPRAGVSRVLGVG